MRNRILNKLINQSLKTIKKMDTTTFHLPYCYKLNTKFMKLLLFLETNFINYTIADNTITIKTGSAVESFTIYYLFRNYN